MKELIEARKTVVRISHKMNNSEFLKKVNSGPRKKKNKSMK